MALSELVTDFRNSLQDVAQAFTAQDNADFVRHLTVAAADMYRIRPRTLIGEVVLIADVAEYQAPDDLIQFKSSLWGVSQRNRSKPWDKTWPGLLPRCHACGGILSFVPAPSMQQISLLGDLYRFYYVARDTVGETAGETTIAASDRHLLLLRAQAEAMQELSLRDSVRPVQIGGGFGQQAKTGSPAALWSELMKSWLLSVRV